MDDAFELTEEVIIHGVHPIEQCWPRHCTVHNPSDHHMREWPLGWKPDTKGALRKCPHGHWHYDPDQLTYWMQINLYQLGWALHWCDGCCLDLRLLGGDRASIASAPQAPTITQQPPAVAGGAETD